MREAWSTEDWSVVSSWGSEPPHDRFDDQGDPPVSQSLVEIDDTLDGHPLEGLREALEPEPVRDERVHLDVAGP